MTDPAIIGNKKALYHTFGCKLNFAETASLADDLERRGIVKASDGETPDIIIINSCSVTALADKKCRQFIRSLNRKFPSAPVVVTGCYAQLKPDEVAALPGVVLVAGSDRKVALADYVEKWLADGQQRIEVSSRGELVEFTPSCSRGDRTRYFLKVQDGCDYFCSYCTIPYARGRSRSPKIDSLIEQAREVVAAGGREIVLTGVNIGDFGKGSDETFFDLIRRLEEVDGIDRYRISSIEPNLLTDDMIRWIAEESKRFMPHFHIPLQSGDNDVLKLMRRRYDRELFAHKIMLIKRYMPHAFIGVDLIVGARGETDELFRSSREFVESLPITRLHIFPYSERPGTSALANISHTVDQGEKYRRGEVMASVSERKLAAFQSQFVGEVRPVLVEHTSDGETMSGFTDNYIRVRMALNPELFDRIVSVKLLSVDGEEMIGEIVE